MVTRRRCETNFQGISRQPKDESLSHEEKKSRAREITTSRMLTDSDFKKIDAAQLKKTVSALRKGGKKRKREELEIRVRMSIVMTYEVMIRSLHEIISIPS